MFRFSIVTLYFLLLGTCQSNAESTAAAAEVPISLRAKGYAISTQPHASVIDEKWAQYFYDYLRNRVTDCQRILIEGFGKLQPHRLFSYWYHSH